MDPEAVPSAKTIEKDPAGVVKRWIAELDLADTAEKQFRDTGESIWKLYESKSPKANSFNILWSNTETLRPAVYNSTPRADVRRRFRDPDPVGKVSSNVLERTLTYSIDAYDFDFQIQKTVLDVLLPGRGLARIKYVPQFKNENELSGENAVCEHVKWDHFRRGPGDTWDEVPWVAFDHDMPRDQLVEMFGEEIAAIVPLSDAPETSRTHDSDVKSLLKTARVREIWDKAERRVLFICEGVKTGPLAEKDDPLKLVNFFPIPRPIYAIEDTTSLVPQPLYKKYEIQADELNEVTRRIDRIVKAMKVRGAYSSGLSELKKIIESDDNVMTPIENASEVANMGGLDKAIWMMPIDKLAQVLEGLYLAREKIIQTIYEVTGLGDIMRGVSNPHETLGAQQLKSQWGSLRLQRIQREVQRFIRDLIRLKAEIIAEHFSLETLQKMTGIKLPTAEDKARIQMQMQGAPAQPGQPPPQPDPEMVKILKLPTWDDVMALLKSDEMRQYRVDIETDSTVAETVQRDTQGMQESVTAIVNLFSGLAPAIQMGAMSIEVAKSLALSVSRTAKMGQAVEDAVDQMQQPPPQPEQPDHSVEVAKVKAESAEKVAAGKAQADAQKAHMDVQLELQKTQMTAQIETQKAQMDAQLKAQLTQMQEQSKQQTAAMTAQTNHQLVMMQEEAKSQREMMLAQFKAEAEQNKTLLQESVKIIVAEISAKQKAEAAEAAAENEFTEQEA